MRNLSKKILALCLVLVLVLSVQNTVAFAQNASNEKPDLKISSIRDFKTFLHNIENGNDYAGKLIVLTKDLELEAYGANSVRFASNGEFAGTFDGKGHKIYGFEINENNSWTIFGNITSTGKVCNLVIEDVIGRTSGVLCKKNSGLIENCSICDTEVLLWGENGGLVYENNGTIKNCSVSMIGKTIYDIEIGGISYRNEGTIENCSSNVKLDISDEDYWGGYIGGIAYENEGDIINCYSVSSNTCGNNACFGIAYNNSGYVKNSYCAEDTSEYNYYHETGKSKNVVAYKLSYMKSAAFVKELNKNLGTDDLKWELKGSNYPNLENVNEVTFSSLPAKKGVVKSSANFAPQGKTVKLTVSMKKGYELKDITVKTKTGKNVKLTKVKNNVYKFTMPNDKVVVTATTKVTN